MNTRWRGSSPHTRGAPSGRRRQGDGLGIIPAYAGSTPGYRPHRTASADHPRIRGEHDPEAPLAMIDAGSSPHTRGARGDFGLLIFSFRIIPAYAGSTSSATIAGVGDGDHPRIRGEHPAALPADEIRLGSSPHTRGALELSRMASRRNGIIPAYAGSTIGY